MPDDSNANVRLVLDDALTMRTADTVRAALLAAIEPPSGAASASAVLPGLAIDCSAASEIDLTFIQLLIAAQASAGARGRRISFVLPPGGVLLDTLTRGGFRVIPEPGGGFWFSGEAA